MAVSRLDLIQLEQLVRQPLWCSWPTPIRIRVEDETNREAYSHGLTTSPQPQRLPYCSLPPPQYNFTPSFVMSLPRGNYDPRRVCLNPFPEFTLGKHRRTVGVYLAGALVGFSTPACLPFGWYIVSLPLRTGHFWTLPFSLLTPKHPTVPYRKRNPPCTSLSSTGFLASVRCSATSLSTLSTRIGFEEMKDLEIRELFGGRDCSCLSGLHLWREVLLAVWCVYCPHSWTLLMTMSAADCLGFEVYFKRVLRAVHLLRLRQRLPKCCAHAFCCRPLDSSEHEQRVWVQPYSLNIPFFPPCSYVVIQTMDCTSDWPQFHGFWVIEQVSLQFLSGNLWDMLLLISLLQWHIQVWPSYSLEMMFYLLHLLSQMAIW